MINFIQASEMSTTGGLYCFEGEQQKHTEKKRGELITNWGLEHVKPVYTLSHWIYSIFGPSQCFLESHLQIPAQHKYLINYETELP